MQPDMTGGKKRVQFGSILDARQATDPQQVDHLTLDRLTGIRQGRDDRIGGAAMPAAGIRDNKQDLFIHGRVFAPFPIKIHFTIIINYRAKERRQTRVAVIVILCRQQGLVAAKEAK